MPRRLERLRALAPGERWLLVRVVLLLPLIGAALRSLGFKRTRELLARHAPRHAAPSSLRTESIPDEAQRIARLVAIAARHGPYRATCLRQSLALWWLLQRRGIPAALRIGVRTDSGPFRAHAWVEVSGFALGPEVASYVPFANLGPQSAALPTT